MKPPTIYYATSSPFKLAEIEILRKEPLAVGEEADLKPIGDYCDLQFTSVATNEPLEISLSKMVDHKIRSAYRQLLTPCIVEHASLILEKHESTGFPGGLTQPMWDSLEAEDFLERVGRPGEVAIAQAVVGYCDGVNVWTFVGETRGTLGTNLRAKGSSSGIRFLSR